MTDQSTALDGRIERIDLTDGTLTPAPGRETDPSGTDLMVEDEASGDGGRGKVGAMVAGAITLAAGVLFGIRWARKRRTDTTVLVIEEPEAARWRRLLQRGSVPTAA